MWRDTKKTMYGTNGNFVTLSRDSLAESKIVIIIRLAENGCTQIPFIRKNYTSVISICYKHKYGIDFSVIYDTVRDDNRETLRVSLTVI